MSFPTRNRDVDREILKKMDDSSFLSVCTQLLNKRKDDYLDKLCNGDRYYPNLFELRLRSDPRYIGAYEYKPNNISWKKYFTHVLLWVEKLKQIGYDFTGKRGDPKIYHDILSQVNPQHPYDLKILQKAVGAGYLDLLVDLTSKPLPPAVNDFMLSVALIFQKIDIAEYLFSKGARVNDSIIETILNGDYMTSLEFILNTTAFDYAKWFSYLRHKLLDKKTSQSSKKMINFLNEKFKLTLPVLPKITLK